MEVSEVVWVALIGTVGTVFSGPVIEIVKRMSERSAESKQLQREYILYFSKCIERLFLAYSELIQNTNIELSEEELQIRAGLIRVEDSGMRLSYYEEQRRMKFLLAWDCYRGEVSGILGRALFDARSDLVRKEIRSFREKWQREVDLINKEVSGPDPDVSMLRSLEVLNREFVDRVSDVIGSSSRKRGI
ncbi:hypothetical protein [Corynebacterium macclintockiae]|uniref:hypothetical protein n=1 Tax=Corynebacterium macclintockiae TaxID=2913501 RepID=UPI003EBC9BA9